VSLTRVQQCLLAVVVLCIVGALAAGVYGRTVSRRSSPPTYIPPPAPALPPTIIVHVAGEVGEPGLYTLPRGARVQDAVRAAGGLAANADQDAVNLAAQLEDGQRVFIPGCASPIPPAASPATGPPAGQMNLNTATPEQLTELPGIGPELAARIVRYRGQHGPFRSVDALEAVPGIGPKRLAQVRPHVTVR
jgi:competence protein ComEA